LRYLFQQQQINTNAHLLPKNQLINFKVTLVANGQISALIPHDEQWIALSTYIDPFNGLNQRKLLFESNLPSSFDDRAGGIKEKAYCATDEVKLLQPVL
jgi:hypothetical protein